MNNLFTAPNPLSEDLTLQNYIESETRPTNISLYNLTPYVGKTGHKYCIIVIQFFVNNILMIIDKIICFNRIFYYFCHQTQNNKLIIKTIMNDFIRTGTLSPEAEAILRNAFERAIDELRMFNYTQKEFDEYWEAGGFSLESIAAGVYQYLKKDVSKKILSVQLIKKNSKEILCQRDAFFNVLDVMHKNGLFMGKCVCEVKAFKSDHIGRSVPSPVNGFDAADYDEMRSCLDQDLFDASLGLMKPFPCTMWHNIRSDNASLLLWLHKNSEVQIMGKHESHKLCLNSIRINRFRELQSTNTSAANLVRDTIFDRVIVKYYNDHREGFIRDLCAKKYKKDKKREDARRRKKE